MALHLHGTLLLIDAGQLANDPACCCSPGCNCVEKACFPGFPEELECKCVDDPACASLVDIGALTVDVSGNGTGSALSSPSCSAVGCDWTGTFVASCGAGPGGLGYTPWYKLPFICTAFSPAHGAFKDFYYYMEVRVSFTSLATVDKSATAASFGLTVTLYSQTVALTVGTGVFPDEWIEGQLTFSSTESVGTASTVVRQYTGTFSEFLRYETTDCAAPDCQAIGEAVDCGTALTLASTVTSNPATDGGCYADPGDVTVSVSW